MTRLLQTLYNDSGLNIHVQYSTVWIKHKYLQKIFKKKTFTSNLIHFKVLQKKAIYNLYTLTFIIVRLLSFLLWSTLVLLWLCVNCTICLMRFLSTSEKWNERTLVLKQEARVPHCSTEHGIILFHFLNHFPYVFQS